MSLFMLTLSVIFVKNVLVNFNFLAKLSTNIIQDLGDTRTDSDRTCFGNFGTFSHIYFDTCYNDIE